MKSDFGLYGMVGGMTEGSLLAFAMRVDVVELSYG